MAEIARRFRYVAVLGTLLAVATAAMAEGPASPETLALDQAVALALANNRNVSIADQEVQRAEQRIGAARARRLPNLDLQVMAGTTLNTIRVSFPGGAFGTYPGIGPIPATDTDVEAPRTVSGNINATLSQPLTQLHRLGLNVKANELARDIEQQKLHEERVAVVAEVRRVYYSSLQTQSALQAKQERVRAYRELERVVGEQVAREAALPADALDVKARLAGEEYELAGLENDLETGKEQMNLLLGRELTHDFSLVAVPETSAEEEDLASATARAVEKRPDLAQARIAIDQADADRRAKKAERIPDLSLSLTYVSFVNVDLLPRNVAMAGLQLKWEPFDWGRRGKETAEKELQLEQARSRRREAEDRVRLDVAQSFRKLHEARLLIEAERLGRDAAAERLRAVTSRHQQEAALLKDVLDAQAAMSAAHNQYDRALLAFWTAKADLQKALGEEQ